MKFINLTDGQFVKVDDCEYEKVMQHNWYSHTRNGVTHAVSRIGGKLVYMHIFILGKLEGDKFWDHIDRNGLNNQRDNLRPASRSLNAFNSKKRVDNQSGVTGVSASGDGRWFARYGKEYLGSFQNFEDVVARRKQEERKRLQEQPLTPKAQQLLQAHKAYEESLQTNL